MGKADATTRDGSSRSPRTTRQQRDASVRCQQDHGVHDGHRVRGPGRLTGDDAHDEHQAGVDQQDGEADGPDDPRPRSLPVRFPVDAHEGRLEGDEEGDHDDRVGRAGVAEEPPHHHRQQTDDQDDDLATLGPVELAGEQGDPEGHDGADRTDHVLKRQRRTRRFLEREHVERREQRPDGPAHRVGLGVAALGLDVVQDVGDGMEHRRDDPEGPRKLFHEYSDSI